MKSTNYNFVNGDPNCKKCKGTGYVHKLEKRPDLYKDVEITVCKRCDCLIKNEQDAYLGIVAGAKDLKSSKLIDYLGKNIFITGTNEVFNSHLKYCLLNSKRIRYQIVLDNNLIDLWFSDDVEKQKELVSCPFVILKLGNLGYPNQALPGKIFELLNERTVTGKFTWVQTYRDFHSGQNIHEYSSELDTMFTNKFIKVSLGADKKQTKASSNSPQKPDQGSAGKLRNINDRILGS